MPAKIITLHSKTKKDLKKKYDRAIKDARKTWDDLCSSWL